LEEIGTVLIILQKTVSCKGTKQNSFNSAWNLIAVIFGGSKIQIRSSSLRVIWISLKDLEYIFYLVSNYLTDKLVDTKKEPSIFTAHKAICQSLCLVNQSLKHTKLLVTKQFAFEW